MSRNILRKYIKHNEGLLHSVYRCSMGVKTIGVGFNLENPNAKERIAALGVNHGALLSGKVGLTLEQINQLLDEDIETAISTANSLFNNFATLSLERQIILVDMAFNLGKFRLSRFVKFISAVQLENWPLAAAEMQNSLWARQVGRRAVCNIKGMKNNCLPEFI